MRVPPPTGPGAMLARLLVQTAVWLALQGVLVFWPARTFGWPAGWAFLAIMGLGSLATGLWLLWRDPALLAERMRPPVHPGQGGRDAVLLGGIFLLWCLWCLLMGWDARRRGFAAMPLLLQTAGGLLLALGLLGAWAAVASNTFASVTIRVQGEREHRVIDTGAYAWVRHPMYGAALLVFLGIPLLLGSWWGLALVPAFVAALVQRTLWEEALLRAGLPGYPDYARRVPHRFLPGVW